jgi:fibronectin type 3 domain-containing protein
MALVTASPVAAAGTDCAGGATLVSSTPSGAIDGAAVGASVSVAGADVLVGAPGQGTVYVYRRNDFGTVGWVSTLTRPNNQDARIGLDSGFGVDIASDSAVAVVGAPFHESNQGAVVLYTRASDGTWSYLQTIFSPVGLPFGCFGMSVALSDGFLVVGAPTAMNASSYARGAVFLYGRGTNGRYTLLRQFDPLQATATQNKYFGWTVSLVNSSLCISASGEVLTNPVDASEGSVYVYKRDAYGAWNFIQRLKSPGGAAGTFGTDMTSGSELNTGGGTALFVREQRPTQSDIVWKYRLTDGGVPSYLGFNEVTATARFGGAPGTDYVLCNTMAIHEGFALIGRPDAARCNRYTAADGYVAFAQFGPGDLYSYFGQGVAVGRDQYAIGAPQTGDTPGYVSIASHMYISACGSGVSDSCEIALGTVGEFDRNLDGIPDDCELVGAPASLQATQGSYVAGVGLSWPAVQRAYQYQVAKMVDGVETVIATTYMPQYFDETATVGQQVTYRVRAIAGGGDLSGVFAGAVGWKRLSSTVLTASNGTSTASVTLTWNAVSGATAYEVQRSTGTSVETIATVSQLTYADTSATAGTSYGYRVRAKCVFSADATAYGDYSPVAVGKRAADMTPIAVTASNRTSATSITLTWTVPTGTPASYTVLRALGSGKPKAIGTVAAGVLTYVDSVGLKAGKTYTYTVRLATATSGGPTAQGVMATPGPNGVTATDGTLTSGTTVTWTAAAKATGYVVYRAAAGGSALAISSLLGKKVYNFSDTSGTPGITYTYSVRANSSAGLSVAGSDTGWRALSAPTSLTATTNETTKIQLLWTASVGATGYLVNRTGGSGAVQFVSGANSYSDTSADVGVSYTYTVQATAGSLVSASSSAATGVRISGFMGSIMAAGGSSGSSKGGHGRGAQESAEDAAGDELTSAPHHWLVDGTVIESGLVLFGDEDVVEVKLRDPASTEDMSILFVTGELSLGGRLVLDFGDRVPVAGDRWVILLAGRMSGEFRSVRGVDLPAGLRLEAAVDGPTFSVTVLADDAQQ